MRRLKMDQTKSKPINQCDGCRRGLPLNEHGYHEGPGGFWAGDIQYCTRHLYEEVAIKEQKV